MSDRDVYGIPSSAAATLALTSRETGRGFSFRGELAGTAFDVDMSAHLSHLCHLSTEPFAQPEPQAHYRLRPYLRTFVRRGRIWLSHGQGAPETPGSCSRDPDAFRGITDRCQPLISITAAAGAVTHRTKRNASSVSTWTSSAQRIARAFRIVKTQPRAVSNVSVVSFVTTQ
jgi:hypothetical protein